MIRAFFVHIHGPAASVKSLPFQVAEYKRYGPPEPFHVHPEWGIAQNEWHACWCPVDTCHLPRCK